MQRVSARSSCDLRRRGLGGCRAAVREARGAVRLRAGEQRPRVLACERGGLRRAQARLAGRCRPKRHRRSVARPGNRARAPDAAPPDSRPAGAAFRGRRPGRRGARARGGGAAPAAASCRGRRRPGRSERCARARARSRLAPPSRRDCCAGDRALREKVRGRCV
jgi:hypothetical protein